MCRHTLFALQMPAVFLPLDANQEIPATLAELRVHELLPGIRAFRPRCPSLDFLEPLPMDAKRGKRREAFELKIYLAAVARGLTRGAQRSVSHASHLSLRTATTNNPATRTRPTCNRPHDTPGRLFPLSPFQPRIRRGKLTVKVELPDEGEEILVVVVRWQEPLERQNLSTVKTHDGEEI